ncbi:hypothetical protein CVS27_16815 [Arthrobacter glacialis]|uniref:Uncharacterized protein n=1 Tax=Arthrobacter glacialis TaxID=1664 RepID=A0A2S3ZSA9_ARTGL|nr:hypothetical protein CVS27_16815 [Arthrobacter glacialis]
MEGTDFQVLTPEQSKFIDENFGEEAVSLSTAQDLATGVSSGELAVAAADDVSLLADTCNSWKNQVATLGTQSTRTDTGCALIGSSLGQKTYSWAKDLNAKGSICVQGKGYTTTTEQWIIGGCGPSGAVTANWRNVLAHPAIKFEAGVAPVWGVAFKWV